jgi:rare lipoprotein A
MKLPVNRIAPLAAVALLASCGSGGAERGLAGLPPVPGNGPAADYPMVIGEPFTIDGTNYQPADQLNYDAVGYAAIDPAGEQRISGSHKTLPVPSYVEVTSLTSGRTILVRIERRGPMTNSRLLALSPGAMAQLGIGTESNPAIRVRRVNPPEPERSALRAGMSAPLRMETPQSLLTVLRRRLDQQNSVTLSGPPAAGGSVHLPGTPPPVAAPGAVPAPRPGPLATPSPRASASPAPRPAPVATPSAAPTPAPSPVAVSPGSVVVQVAAFSNRASAQTVANRVDGSVVQSGRLYRVRIGPFANSQAAQAALVKARSAGYSDARIQRAD